MLTEVAMKKPLFKNSRGFTLVEVLASITILAIVMLTVGAILANNAGVTKKADDSLSALQIATGILRAYQKKNFNEVQQMANTTQQADIQSVLGLDSAAEISGYKAYVSVSLPADSSLSDRLLLVKVKVDTGNNPKPVEVKGYVKK